MSGGLLAGLDDEQRLAAEALYGPVRILAGAGTGKTRTIVHRIAHGVATGAYAPNRVLALTFTNRAAAELRTRLRALGAGEVNARTFHAAALAQLNFFWPQLVGGSAPALLPGKAALLGQAASALALRVDQAVLRDAAAEIEWRKVSGLSLDAYRLATRPVPAGLTGEQVLDLMAEYERLKDERRQIDFEDVLLVTAGMIQSEPSVALQVREQYRHFVVDEYQDVSPLQQQLLDVWLGERRELCVVGDASQTIYSFAGATSDYLLGFERRYPDAALVRLEHNYRSRAGIVEAANAAVRGVPGAIALRATGSSDGPGEGRTDSRRREAGGGAADSQTRAPTLTVYDTDAAEAAGIAAAIAQQLAAGERPESIAVLYRVNVQSAAFEQAFAAAGIPYRLHGAKRFFDLPEVKQAVLALRGASVAVVDEPLFKSVSDVLRSLGWTQSPPVGQGAVRGRWESLSALMRLADEAAPGTTFRQFTEELLQRQAQQHEPTVAAVTLATIHSVKGLEWGTVYLVGLSEGLLPISYATTLAAQDEERRLLYVAITRARERLELSWAAQGPRRERRSASRFLADLGSRIAGADSAARH
ncbi:ATP-dependent helicase [Gryllotalpicola sp.]|uniref:ATP-dependent helicase n=1 Tax=Gryllotalpicola sp. TaxID=1932787 RepID=UPI0026336487|nr:ATP-dependent helicase [Gryllotalpicola sp.]